MTKQALLSPLTRDEWLGHGAMALFAILVARSFSLDGMPANLIDPYAITAVRFTSAALIMGAIGRYSGFCAADPVSQLSPCPDARSLIVLCQSDQIKESAVSTRPDCTATQLVDDDKVRVTRFEFEPGAQTGWHVHGMDYVITAVTDCQMHLELPGGATNDVLVKAGEAYVRDRGVEHNVINGGDAPMVFIETELKA